MHERVWGNKNIPDELTIHHEQHTFHERQLDYALLDANVCKNE